MANQAQGHDSCLLNHGDLRVGGRLCVGSNNQNNKFLFKIFISRLNSSYIFSAIYSFDATRMVTIHW